VLPFDDFIPADFLALQGTGWLTKSEQHILEYGKDEQKEEVQRVLANREREFEERRHEQPVRNDTNDQPVRNDTDAMDDIEDLYADN
jgi:hypothetical protein